MPSTRTASVPVDYTDHDATTHRAQFSSWSDALDFVTTYGIGAHADFAPVANSKLYLEV